MKKRVRCKYCGAYIHQDGQFCSPFCQRKYVIRVAALSSPTVLEQSGRTKRMKEIEELINDERERMEEEGIKERMEEAFDVTFGLVDQPQSPSKVRHDITSAVTPEEAKERRPGWMNDIDNGPLLRDSILMSREDYAETLRFAGIEEKEVQRRLKVLDEYQS